jgi:hypothetical protein
MGDPEAMDTVFATEITEAEPRFELRFDSMFVPGRGVTFPCDAQGRVDMDSLTERALRCYLVARAAVGREFLTPAVRLSDLH